MCVALAGFSNSSLATGTVNCTVHSVICVVFLGVFLALQCGSKIFSPRLIFKFRNSSLRPAGAWGPEITEVGRRGPWSAVRVLSSGGPHSPARDLPTAGTDRRATTRARPLCLSGVPEPHFTALSVVAKMARACILKPYICYDSQCPCTAHPALRVSSLHWARLIKLAHELLP